MNKYKMRIRIKNHSTFWEYSFEASDHNYALNHIDAIKSGGFTNVNSSGSVEYFAPSDIAYMQLSPVGDTPPFENKYPAKKVLP